MLLLRHLTTRHTCIPCSSQEMERTILPARPTVATSATLQPCHRDAASRLCYEFESAWPVPCPSLPSNNPAQDSAFLWLDALNMFNAKIKRLPDCTQPDHHAHW
ncbi:hypothetical protein VFPPC_17817 [Pochonia chlamydosporia 170]|uniref:Uncharacterized protein n=1 Tax=Pochonia chlamydosporia 170 TaxID=1380566 RepID=A0A219AQB9_METCM|nr:hypothetical protein VFPPC_17817 [Pochonia chlamydosporia 170]OWT42990.1 hypothetical protein VFPPC_17817 [Pochonia chlamydosporia 170]